MQDKPRLKLIPPPARDTIRELMKDVRRVRALLELGLSKPRRKVRAGSARR